MEERERIAQQSAVADAVQRTRIVVVDIETVTLDLTNDKGALDAMTGRVVCIGMLIDDGTLATEIVLAGEDERRLITAFWRTVAPSDVIVGHNVQEFDLRFLRQRSWILAIEPSRTIDTRRYYTRDVVDSLQIWTEWSGKKKGVTLHALGNALGCGAKTGNGANVARWWAERDLESIKAYCQQDVRLAYQIFCRLTFRKPKQFPSEVKSVSTGPVGAATAGFAEEDVCRA
jgi:DNA polymerase elongation subunit (family B)